MIKTFGDKTPKIADSAFVSEKAYIIGDVEIGESSNIWPGVVIRADIAPIRIGRNVSIQDNTVLHADSPLEIGDNALIGHSAVVHCSRIGRNVLIGINATILDNVEVGDYSIVGAGAVVGEGMKIPSRSFVVGVPAQIKKELSPDKLQMLEQTGGFYSQLGQEYKRQGF